MTTHDIVTFLTVGFIGAVMANLLAAWIYDRIKMAAEE